jgi:CO/xanthine dehydrogenase Mo-binding subunit
MENTSSFLEDIYPKNFLYAITIRSPIAKGYLKLIQIPRLPENYKLITARNIPGENRLEDTQMPILANTSLSYIGEPIALLLGTNKTKLEELVKQCKVLVDEETPVFSCVPQIEKTPIERRISIGDTQSVFEKSGKIIAGTYITGIQDHWYAEPSGAVTFYQNNALVVKTATQWPYHVKRSVARMLGIEASGVCVEPTLLNMHMDGKLSFSSLLSCHAALGTFITKKPVRLILNREEDFLYSPKRCKTQIDITSTVDDKGNITASEIDISVNLGAYSVNGEEILDQVCLGTMGFYRTDNLKITAKAANTNIPPQGPFSGFGLAQGAFAMERHISHIAYLIGSDPAQWRKERADSPVIVPSGTKGQVPVDELITKTTSMSDYFRKWASYELLRASRKDKHLTYEKGENLRGIGLALGYQGNGLLYHGEDKGVYSLEVTLTKDSNLEIKSSITSSDENYHKIWAKVSAEILAIDPEKVCILKDKSPDGGPSCSSRNITILTKLVEKCCHAIKKQRFHDPLPITVRRSCKPQNGSFLDGHFPPAEGKAMDLSGFIKPGMAAAAVEVTVDLVECIPKIRGIWLGVDGGKIISRNRARRSLTRSIIQSLGWAFMEDIDYIDGVLPKNKYDSFNFASPSDIPFIQIEFLSGTSGEPKGIGDLPFTCVPAAFIQAVSQAMDFCYKTIPLKRNEIFDVIRIRNKEAQVVK